MFGGKKSKPGASSQNSDENDLRNRFGAAAFVENIDSSEEDENVLSLDSLRAAFASLDDEEEEMVRSFPEISNQEEIGAETEAGKPVYDENFDTDFDTDFVITDTDNAPIVRSDDPSETFFGEEKVVEPTPKTILEAMLFVGDRENKPLRADRAAEKMRNVSPEEIDKAVQQLNRDYRRLGCPYTIRKEDEGYRLILKNEFAPIRDKFYGNIREARLSQQAIDTLAIVAYRQPITADEVQKIRSQPSTSLLNQLVRRELLSVEQEIRGKKKVPIYRTTDRFLELFQLDSLDDLPISEDLDFR